MNQTPPAVSVIIPTYNWSSVLRYAIASVEQQSFANFELLVIGDGCTDDSAEVVASFRDPRFHWLNLPENHGHQSRPNNEGLALAHGQWIAYLGHDDLWMPHHLARLLEAAERAAADVAFSLAMVIGAPDCGGRKLFGAFAGPFPRGAHLPPSALLHRRTLIEEAGGWPDYRAIRGSPETDLLARFYDHGAKFTAVEEVTVFKFPSTWRPLSYQKKSCAEQADFFSRMQSEPDFLERELTQLALAQELLKPHTRVAPRPREADLTPGAVVEGFRRVRGLTSEQPEEGEPIHVPNAALRKLIQQVAAEEVCRQQASRFGELHLFYAEEGRYGRTHLTRVLVRLRRWTRVRIELEFPSEGASLRLDPCEQPALIQIAWLALRRGPEISWHARGPELAKVRSGGDLVRLPSGRTLNLRSTGNDPRLFLPNEAVAGPPLWLDCWIRIDPAG